MMVMVYKFTQGQVMREDELFCSRRKKSLVSGKMESEQNFDFLAVTPFVVAVELRVDRNIIGEKRRL